MKKNAKHIRIYTLLAVLACLMQFPGWSFYRQIRQQRLDQALIVACSRLDISAVQTALHAGANPNAVDMSFWPAPSLRERLQALLTRRTAPPRYFPPALIKAYEASIGRQDNREQNLLPIVLLLLEKRANPDVRNLLGETLVDNASQFRADRPLALLLLQRGAHPDHLDKCLAQACEADDMESIRLLLQRGANPNAVSRLDCESTTTPLESAILKNRIAMVAYLLQHGANPNARLAQDDIAGGLSPLLIARTLHKRAIIALLKKAGAKE